MDFFCFAMKHDLTLMRGQLAKRHVRPHAKLTDNILHQRPHQCLPRQHSALVDRQRFIGNKGRFVHHMNDARSVTMRTSSLAVERKLLCTDRLHKLAAYRTMHILFSSVIECRRHIMTVRASI